MVKPGFKEAVEDFVKNGGTFVTTYFTGLIDENVGVFLNGYLGPLKDVMGVKVDMSQWLQSISKVTKEEIQSVANKIELDTIYFLSGSEGNN